uniref:Uncharacterized protein n=1 Tax=Arundo donax TaxID=35708 RepID=A0A0A8YL34_ARUDO
MSILNTIWYQEKQEQSYQNCSPVLVMFSNLATCPTPPTHHLAKLKAHPSGSISY